MLYVNFLLGFSFGNFILNLVLEYINFLIFGVYNENVCNNNIEMF